MNPKVSIGLPVYNGARFLQVVLKSLTAQSFSDFEILVSDNASTDDTEAICRAFAAQEPRIKYFRQPINCGGLANFQFVLERATGTYFVWSAADDLAMPDMLTVLVRVLDTYPRVVLAVGDTEDVDVKTRKTVVREMAGIRLDLAQSFPWKNTVRFFRNPTSNVFFAFYGLYRTSVLREASLNYRGLVKYAAGSEIPFLAQIALRGLIVSTPQVLKIYQRHEDSVFHVEQQRMKGRRWFPYAVAFNITAVLLRIVTDTRMPGLLKAWLLGVVLWDGALIPARAACQSLRSTMRGFRRLRAR